MTVLVVDIGTTNTVAVTGAPGSEPRLVTVDGAPWIPSAVYAGPDGPVVGADAVRLGRGAADRDVRAVLTRVVAAAGQTPDELVLTHPAGWPADRVAELLAAAAGLAPAVHTVTAPVAAAAGAGLDKGQALLVVDAGGGTCDVALVRRDSAGLTVLACASLPADFDQRILDRVAPSLREPVETPRDRQLLRDSARAAKELLSRHERADIVLPDHRVVRLTRTEFEELITPDVDRVIALAAGVVGQTVLKRVLLVGGASRVPLLARRLTEAAGRPVVVDPEPETAVARGAAQLVTTPPERSRPRVAIAALTLALLLVAVILVLPGQQTTGRATAGAAPPTSAPPPTLPPAVAGTELVNTDRPTYDDGRFGEPVTYRHRSGTELELVFSRIETRPLGAGYRWLYVSYQARNVRGPEWREPFASTAALDDRGQWIRPLGGGVACEGSAEPVTRVPAEATVEICGLLPVPDQTTVEAIVFGDRDSAVRVPTSVVAVQGAGPAPASIAGRLGGPPVTVDLGEGELTAAFELVVTPSAYLGERRPSGGNRLVVLRGVLSTVTDHEIYLRDDRGVLTAPLPEAGDLPDCPSLTASDEPVYGCLVYEVDADSPIAGVTVGRPLEEDADLADWPTWTP